MIEDRNDGWISGTGGGGSGSFVNPTYLDYFYYRTNWDDFSNEEIEFKAELFQNGVVISTGSLYFGDVNDDQGYYPHLPLIEGVLREATTDRMVVEIREKDTFFDDFVGNRTFTATDRGQTRSTDNLEMNLELDW